MLVYRDLPEFCRVAATLKPSNDSDIKIEVWLPTLAWNRQVFDENGKFLDQWEFGPRPPIDIHSIYMGSDHALWAADEGTNKLLGYDASGRFLYSWGTYGTCSRSMWAVHGFATDSEGNLYTAEVRTGRAQKYTPRKGANPAFLVGEPWTAAKLSSSQQ